MSLPDVQALLADAPHVRDALERAGWSSRAVDQLLGATYRTHLDRDELAPVLRRTADRSPLATLARLFIAGTAVDTRDARRAGVPQSWLRSQGANVTAVARLQPVAHGGLDVTLPHDPGRAATGVHPEQVLGVGAASLTLAAATPREPVQRALDLGTGCGIQAVLLEDTARTVVATDSNARATGYARLAAVLNGLQLEVREGDLLEPVRSERFDLVVSNPPFVVSPGRRYTYRDAGLPGDEVCRRLVKTLPSVLEQDGLAVLLVNWLHLAGEDGDDRVRSWFEGTGCDGWIVQRELADPADYVTAWLRDSDEGERFDTLYDEWCTDLERSGVEAVAFGVLAMRRTDGPTAVVLDEVDHAVAPTWGEQVRAHFAARDALRAGPAQIMQVPWRLRADVRLTQLARATPDGWAVERQAVQQQGGLRRTGEVDAYGAALLAGCDGTRPLAELVAVLAVSAGLSPGEAAEQVLPVIRSLVEQGFLVPPF